MILCLLGDWEFTMVVCNAKIMLIIEGEHVCTNYIPWSYWDVMMYHLVLRLCLLKCKTCSTFLMKFSMSSFILTQCIDSHARSFVFFLFPCHWCCVGLVPVFLVSHIITCLPFIIIPSITAMSYLNDQYILMSCCNWSLISGHPVIMYPFSCCKCSSCAVACCICRSDMHSGM